MDIQGGFDGRLAAAERRDVTKDVLDDTATGRVLLRIEPATYGARTVLRPLDPGQSLEIGSGRAVDARVDDPTVSARHCRVEHTGRGIAITDLGARNGVRVAGVRVDRALLPVG